MTDEFVLNETGLDAVKLGEPRDEIRRRLRDFRSFRRTPTAPENDQFPESGVMVTYDADGRASLIELAPPARPVFHGVPLLGRELAAVLADLVAADIAVDKDDQGAYLPQHRVGLFALEGLVQGVSVGE